jgi:uncharacterized protein YaeQ
MKLLFENWRKYLKENDEQLIKRCLSDEDEPDVFYHSTPARLVNIILEEGLIPDKGGTFSTTDWVAGKVFLSAGYTQAVQWQEMIAEQLQEDVAILEIKLTPEQISQLEVDTISQEEGDSCSFFLKGSVLPFQIEIADTGEGTGDFNETTI